MAPLQVFTSRPDTLFGVQYLVVSPEHELVNRATLPAEYADRVLTFVRDLEKARNLENAEESKEGE